jgi:predicted nucleic acid-binding protein
VTELGRELVVPGPVLVEVDQLLRTRVGAVEIDARFADLGLGLVDGCVMAIAERMRAPILTFDFEHFRATRPASGFWRLVVDEARYADATGA